MSEIISEETNKKYYKFPEIENSYREAFIIKIKEKDYANIPYFITEKIHGTNTQIKYNLKTKEFIIGGRQVEIKPEDKFYNAQDVLSKYFDKVEYAAELLSNKIDNLEEIIVYGELFGGYYPHKDISVNNKANKVQKGVYYSPNNEWKAFDISYTNGGEFPRFISGKDFFDICNQVNIDTVPLLKVCNNLDEALSYPNDGQSVVYQSFNLPKLEEDNIMEGVVIKPWEEDLWIGQRRIAIKNKNEKFAEKAHASNKVKEEIVLSEEANKAIEEISQYINENRINNVISHLGEVTVKDIGKIIGLSATDALNDYKKDYATLDNLEAKEAKYITKYLQSEIAKIVRKVVLKCETFV